MTGFGQVIAEIGVDPGRALAYAEGWQSWSPSLVIPWGEGSPRPRDERLHDHFWRRGAPVLASVHAGLTSLRVSPDTGPAWNPPGGDLSQPAGRSAVLTGRARAHLASLIRPDPDVLMAGREVERREDLAAYVGSLPANVRATGDRLGELDDWGIAVTRELLSGGSCG